MSCFLFSCHQFVYIVLFPQLMDYFRLKVLFFFLLNCNVFESEVHVFLPLCIITHGKHSIKVYKTIIVKLGYFKT